MLNQDFASFEKLSADLGGSFGTPGRDLDLPSDVTLLYRPERIEFEVKRLGVEITEWARQANDGIIAMPVLTGAIFFFADLMREVKAPVSIVPIEASAYDLNDKLNSSVGMKLGDTCVKGRCLLLVDDIWDTGTTLQALSKAFYQAGAAEVRTAILVQRNREESGAAPDYLGFKHDGSEWLVGYGMDSKGEYRNLPAICAMEEET